MMQLRYLLGVLVMMSATYQCVVAEGDRTATNKGSGSDVNVDSQDLNTEKMRVGDLPSDGNAMRSPKKLVKPVQSNAEPTETDRTGSFSDGQKSSKTGNGGAGASQPTQPSTRTGSSERVAEPAQINTIPAETVVYKSGTGKNQEPSKPLLKPISSDANANGDKTAKAVENTKQILKPPSNSEEGGVPGDGKEKAHKSSFKPARILVMLPMPFYSHTLNYMPIFKELAERGHHMTVVSPYPQNISLPNWEEILVENFLPELMAAIPDRDFSKNKGIIGKMFALIMLGENSVRLTFGLEPVLKLFNDDSREFDLIFLEPQFIQEPLLAFGHKFKAPVIAIYPSYIVPEVAYYTGNPVMTSTYVPNMAFPFSNSMNFVERATNTLFNLFKIISYNFYVVPKMDRLMREYIPSKDLPYLGDMLFNISFTLMDTHQVLNYPYPRVNNMREFLGVNTKPTGKLSPELQEYMDEGVNGVIFFTLGSHYQTSTLRPHILNSLLQAFSRIPNRILMKWDKDEPPPGLSSNVKTAKWFPQSAILAHKNCIGFITHTGVHGLVESLAHAVPVISVPLFADQYFFSRWVVEKGVGLAIDIETVTPEIAYETIRAVITDKKYKENVIEISELMGDSPQTTLSEITYWVEYVIRTKGARHLRPGSINLAWYQRFGLDLLAAAVVITVVPLWLLSSLLKCLVLMCRPSKMVENDTTTVKSKSKKAKKTD